MKKVLFNTYIFVFLCLFLYSFTQIDLGLVISRYPFFYQIEKGFQYIGYFNRPLSTIFYLLIIFCLTILYIVFLRLALKKSLNKHFVWKIIGIGAVLLLFSYNAFSYDLFNYIFDAKIITHYHANPYFHKALDYPGDPMLAFMHWTHRVYPYGPLWLVLTVPLSFIGLQLFLPTFFLFKFLMAAGYIGSLYYIGKIFQKIRPEREILGLVFFGLNPLILIECLVSAHIDIVMVFFSLMAFDYLLQKKYVLSYCSLFFSISIKFLTGLLLPIFIFINFLQFNKKKIDWDKLLGVSVLVLIVGVVFEAKQSGNFQPWYLVALLSYTVFLSHKYYVFIPSIIISILSLFLYMPYLYLGNWNPPVPQILSFIMFISYAISLLLIIFYFFYRKQSIHQVKSLANFMEKKKIIIIFIIIFILQLFFRIYSYRNDYLTQYNASYWKERFENSQWSNKPACSNLDPHVNPYTCIWDDRWYENHKNDLNAQYLKKNSIGDDGLYTYAGWAYIHGKDPTTLNAEIPPFGKYLIGLSEIIFNNQNIFALISSLFVLVAFYLLNTVLFKDKVLAFIPVVLFSFDPLFYTQLNTTMLDALYLGLLFLIFYFFLRRQFIVSAIFLGLMTATKSPVSTFVLISLVTLFYIFLTKQKHVLKQYFVSLSVAIIVFILTYLKYFLEGHSLKAFLGVQKWIITFYLHGAKGSLITPWEMIITGKWHTWWGTYIPFSLWHVGWWLITPLSMLAIYIMIRRRHTRSMSLIAIWLIAYFSMLSLIPTWPRYLLLVLPFMYNFSIWIVYNIPIVKKVWSKIT